MLNKDKLGAAALQMKEMKVSERSSLPGGVSEGRAPQILAGAVVAKAAMDLAGIDNLELCPWALREGIIVNYLDHLDYFPPDGSPPKERRIVPRHTAKGLPAR